MVRRTVPRDEDLKFTTDKFDYGLLLTEFWWVRHQLWLEGCGYILRPRLRPDWIPSWYGTDKSPDYAKDGQVAPVRTRLCSSDFNS